ncbi:MAG: hypothetical protein AAGD07_04255 [Planctomycetota bacterium]
MSVVMTPGRTARTVAVTEPVAKSYLVNAAFLEEIKDSNPAFWDAVSGLRQSILIAEEDLERPQRTIKQMVVALGDLQAQLAIQYSLEESYGYVVIAAAPSQLFDPGDHLALQALETAEKTVRQHRSLYLELSELAEHAEELQYRGCGRDSLVAFVSRLDAFNDQLAEHERLENSVMVMFRSRRSLQHAAIG